MIYGYIRVSTDKQTVENQRFEISKFIKKTGLKVDCWIEETISGTISQRTKEALSRKKAEVIKLGRPKGKHNKKHKLSGCEYKIRMMLHEGYPKTLICKQLNVSPSTLYLYLKSKHIYL